MEEAVADVLERHGINPQEIRRLTPLLIQQVPLLDQEQFVSQYRNILRGLTSRIYRTLADIIRIPNAEQYRYYWSSDHDTSYRVGPDGVWQCKSGDERFYHACTGRDTETLNFLPAYREAYFNQQLKAGHWRCSLSGQCEASVNGGTLEDCQQSCQSAPNKDLIYQTLAYELDAATELPPSDQVRVVYEIIGQHVAPHTAYFILEALIGDDWELQRSIPELQAFLVQQHGRLGIFTRDLVLIFGLNPAIPLDWDVLKGQVAEVLQGELGQDFRTLPRQPEPGLEREAQDEFDMNIHEVENGLAEELAKILFRNFQAPNDEWFDLTLLPFLRQGLPAVFTELGVEEA